MQVFLPYPDFKKSAQTLDMRRLGKQRVENYQIVRAALGLAKGWAKHPVTILWKDYLHNLYGYQIRICEEWTSRGYKDTTLTSLSMALFYHHPVTKGTWYAEFSMPPFVTEEFCLGHRQLLLKKNPMYYESLFVKTVTCE